jgi:hypothetical protein
LYELTDIVHRQVHPLLEHIEHWNFPAFSVISQSGEKEDMGNNEIKPSAKTLLGVYPTAATPWQLLSTL